MAARSRTKRRNQTMQIYLFLIALFTIKLLSSYCWLIPQVVVDAQEESLSRVTASRWINVTTFPTIASLKNRAPSRGFRHKRNGEMQTQNGEDMEDLGTSARVFSLAKRKLLSKNPSMLNSAVINGKVSLACDISPSNSDDSVALILWYKDDSLAPIYTIDARKANTLDKAKTSIDEAYATRATFNTKSKPAHLQLEQVRPQDEGDYRCRVDFKRGRTVNTIISLRVIVPPEEVRIVAPSRPTTKLEGLIGPFNEGSELTLVCLASGGRPRPQISWRRDFNVIDETYQHVDKEGTSNELKIPALNKNHLLSIFTCQASNSNLTSPMQTSITLDLNLKPQEVVLKPLVQEPLVVGQTVTFECLTQGSRPQATIHWLFQGSRHDAPMNADQQQTSSRLTLIIQRNFNQQPLTCVAENPRIAQPAAALRQTMKLDVHYAPQLRIKLEPAKQDKAQPEMEEQLQEGNDIYLTCQLDANPRPTKPVLWRFNGRVLQQSSSMIVMNNQSLVLRKVNRLQSGAYTCEANNQHGSNTSKPLELVIRHAPVCSTDDILVLEAAIGQTVSIDCQVQANPSRSVHYSWFFASQESNLTNWLQRDASLDEQIDDSSLRLRFKIKDESSFGLLKCKAKNEIGLQQKPCLFQVAQASIPSLKHSCSLANSSANSLQVSCSPNEHLKSEDFELSGFQQLSRLTDGMRQTGSKGRASGSMGSWLDLEAIKAQQPVSDSMQANSQIIEPALRLVYPPSWILAELYKLQGNGESQDESNQNLELVAYVIVGSASQLARIKSIVEDNQILSSMPRGVYYVAARQVSNATNNGNLSSISNDNNNNNNNNADKDKRILHSLFHQNSRFLEDPSIQLNDSFYFTVPSLEPRKRYKLLIYGQNLANKTRDWSVVRGETLQEDSYSSLNGRSQLVNDSVVQDFVGTLNKSINSNQQLLKEQPTDESSGLDMNQSGQQKSIVMRSDSDNSNNNGLEQQQQQSNSLANIDRLTADTKLGDSSSSSALSFVMANRLSLYKDYAITYARQRPLLAVPMALSISLVLLLLIVWTSSLLVQLMQGKLRQPRRRSSLNEDEKQQHQQVKEQQKETLNSLKGEKSNNIPRGDPIGANKLNHSSPVVSYASSSRLQSTTGNSTTNSPDNQQSSLPFINGCHLRQGVVNNVYTISSDETPTRIHNQLDGCNSIALEPPTSSLLQSSHLSQGKIYPTATAATTTAADHQFEGFVDGRHFIGSLDRRHNAQHQQLYLTEAGGNLLQIYQQHQQQQQQQHQYGGSIDRRSFLNNKQQLFVQDVAPLEQGVYLKTQMSNQNGGEPIQCYNGGSSFSSATEYSSEQYPQQTRPKQQRVAFDLSNQMSVVADQYARFDCPIRVSPAPNNELHLNPASDMILYNTSNQLCDQTQICAQLYADTSLLAGQQVPKPRQRVKSLKRQELQQQIGQNLENGKSSDSGGSSNSANTAADSGHESPATGEINTTTTSVSYNQSQTRLKNNLRTVASRQSTSSCPHHRSTPNGEPIAIRLDVNCTNRHNLNGNNMSTLTELSPGSQESSTLMHSVDSFAEFPPNQLQLNHEMATSFTSANELQLTHVAGCNRVVENNEEINNWL